MPFPAQRQYANRLSGKKLFQLSADLVGHERIEATRIYLRRTASEQQTIADKIVTG